MSFQARPVDQARNFYEKLVSQFPNAGRYWKAYIEHELRAKNFENVEKVQYTLVVFSRQLATLALSTVLDASPSRGPMEVLRVLRPRN